MTTFENGMTGRIQIRKILETMLNNLVRTSFLETLTFKSNWYMKHMGKRWVHKSESVKKEMSQKPTADRAEKCTVF